MKVLAQNKKAYHEYNILSKIEAGIVLTGDEVKSARAGQATLLGSFAVPRGNEIYLLNAHFSAYDKAYKKTDDQARASRKLLLHKREITKLIGEVSRKGLTLVPLRMYLNKKNLIKVELGLARHKKAAGKKQHLKERDIDRQAKREIKDRTGY